MDNPRFLTLTLADADVNYNLLELLMVVDPEFSGNYYKAASRIVIQADLGAGSTSFKIGNPDLSATNFGIEFVASQSVLYEDSSDTIGLYTLWLRANAAGKKIHVSIQFR